MPYEWENGRVITESLEYSVAYHCNLRCANCSHLSPFVTKKFPSLESFISDLGALAEVVHARVFRLLGGEPLLNPEINSFVAAAKRSGIADRVMVTTNGLLLHRMDDTFWRSIDLVLVTVYPGISLERQLDEASDKAAKFDTELWLFPMNHFRTTIVTEPHPNDWLTSAIFMTCRDAQIFQCNMIHEGYLYKCAVPPFLPDYLARLGKDGYEPRQDGFPIHGTRDSLRGLADFLMSTETPEACRYCLGYLGIDQNHRQLAAEEIATPSLLAISREHDLDRDKLRKELFAFATGNGRNAKRQGSGAPTQI